jgi:hypothetical protein
MTMQRAQILFRMEVAALLGLYSAISLAKLPPPTPEQAQQAAAKKAQADAQSEKDKKALAATMDAVAARWRSQAAAKGWTTHPPTPVAAVPGMNVTTSQSSASGQPGGQQGSAAKQVPIRSEKAGTAPPSTDVKQVAPGNPK